MARTLPQGKQFAQDPRVNSLAYACDMDVYEVRRARLAELLKQVSASEIARRSGVAASLISRYQYAPGRDGAKNLGEENARKIEAAAGKHNGWLDRQHPNERPAAAEVAHDLSQWKIEHAPVITWEQLMQNEKLPTLFWAELQDDAMSPRAPRGRRICFDSTVDPSPGDGVLLADSSGGLHFRQYRAGAAGRWIAHALNPAYQDLDSERDGLRVLAVLKAEEGRWRG